MKAKLQQIIPWILYDFANAPFAAVILTFVFSTYYTKYIAVDEVTGTSLWASTLTISALIIGVFSPVFGAIADQSGRKKPWLFFFAFVVILITFGLTAVKPDASYQYKTLVMVLIATACYNFAQVFYNSLLLTVAPTHMIGRVSGIGWGAGYFGGLCCLVLTLFYFIPKEDNLNALAQGVKHSLLLVGSWYILFSLPIFLLLKEETKKTISIGAVRGGINQLINTIKSLKDQKTLVGFLIAFFFYSDAITTILNFGGIYAATVLNFSFYEVIIFAVVINLVAGLGATVLGLLDDKIGPSKLIFYSLCVCLLCSIMVLTFQNAKIFWIFGCLLGLFIGPIQSASRSMLSHIVPKENITEMFGLYALTGRLSTFIGPLIISLITYFFRSKTAGMFVVVLMFSIGLVLMIKFFHLKFKKSLWDFLKWW
jgi:UMF1 family MFS transporter